MNSPTNVDFDFTSFYDDIFKIQECQSILFLRKDQNNMIGSSSERILKIITTSKPLICQQNFYRNV